MLINNIFETAKLKLTNLSLNYFPSYHFSQESNPSVSSINIFSLSIQSTPCVVCFLSIH